MSMVEGSLSVDIQLAAGSLARLQKQLSDLEKGVSLKVATNSKGVHEATRAVDGLNASAQRAANSVNQRLGGAAKATAATFGVLAGVAGAALIGIATKAVLAGKEFNILQQGVRASLTAILGTSAAAEGLLKKVNLLNDTSPFPRSTFLSATQQLVGFGVEADKVTGILDAVQEAVAGIGGDSNDIARFSRLFAQIQSQGRLTGDVLFSLGEKGIDAAALIGAQMGKTGQQIKDEVTKGTIGADQAIDLLTKGLKTKFSGAVENVGKSFVGAQDRVTARLRDIGADLTKAFINPLGGGAAVDGLNNIAVALSNIRKNVVSQLLPGVRSMADLFVKATESFKNFTANLKVDQIQRFLDILKLLAPLAALAGTSLVKSLGAMIPGLAGLTGALNGPVLALGALVIAVPELRAAFLTVIQALQPAVETLLPALQSLLTSVAGVLVTISPIFQALATAASMFITALTPLLKVMNFAPINTILLLLIANFIRTRIAGTVAFQQIAVSAGTATMSIRAATFAVALTVKSMGLLGAAGAVAMAAVRGIGTALAGLATPANLALAGIILITNGLAKADAHARNLVDTAAKGLNIEVPEELDTNLERLKKDLDAATKIDEDTGLDMLFNQLTSFIPGFSHTAINAERAVKKLNKEIEVLEGKKRVKADIIAGVSAATGRTFEQVAARAKEMGITLTEIPADEIAANIKKISDAINEVGTVAEENTAKIFAALTPQVEAFDKIRAAQDKLVVSERALANLSKVTAQEFKDGITKASLGLVAARRAVGESADRVKSAEIGLAEAKRGVTQADERLIELTKERNALLADTNAEVRELADAEAGLARTKAELIDQDQREAELRRNLADLAREGPDKLAAADRAILRAKIALNTATREQIELQESLNQSQAASPDLSGLSLDQIKTKLAGARAQLAVQRATKTTQKSAQEIEDEGVTAKLNVVDAEQAHRDAIQARADLELDLNIQKREDEEALQALHIDHESSLRRQEEQQIALSKLRTGDTETARTLKGLNEQIILAVEGVSTAALALNTAEREVLAAKDQQLTATLNVRDAEIAVRDAKGKQAEHTIAIRDAQKTVKDDTDAIALLTAETVGDNETINRLLLARLGINAALLQQNPEMVQKVVDTIIGAAVDPIIGGQETHLVLSGGARQTRENELMDILLNHPEKLDEYLKRLFSGMGDGPGAVFSGGTALNRVNSVLGNFPGARITSTYRTPEQNRRVGGSPTSYHLDKNNPAVDIGGPINVLDELYRRLVAMGGWRELLWRVAGHYDHIHAAAEGAIVTRHTLAQLGEGGKAEVVLPLTKPARAMTLLAQSIPLMHTSLQKRLMPALAPQQTASVVSVASVLSGRGSTTSGAPFVPKSDGPVTYGQLQELIALIKAQKSGSHVEAPITVMSSGQDEELLARKISNRVEKKVAEILSRR